MTEYYADKHGFLNALFSAKYDSAAKLLGCIILVFSIFSIIFFCFSQFLCFNESIR